MYRSRSAAVVVLAFLSTGCAGLRRGSLLGREGGFGPAVEPPPDAVAMGSFLKGEVALTQNDMETALAAFQAAVRADPDAPLLRLRLAPLYVRSGQLDRALEQVDAVVKLEPTNLEALSLQAGVLSALGRDDEAVATYERVLKLDPESQDAYLYLGALYSKKGEDRKSTRLNSSHQINSYAVFCLKKKTLRSTTTS